MGRLFCVILYMDEFEEFFDKTKQEIISHSRENLGDGAEGLSKKVNSGEQKKLLRKKFNKLKHKALYINAEYEDVCDVFAYAKKEFISGMFVYCGRNKIKPPFADKEEGTKGGKSEMNDELKDLYRDIVKATHPDMTKNLSDEDIEQRKKLYLDAVQGKKEGNFWGILKAALELDMPIKELSFSYLEELEDSINNLEENIRIMKNDLMYKWYYAPEGIQLSIFEQLTQGQEKYE